MLKRIGTEARHEMERMLGHKVFLELFVKVRPGWRDSSDFVEGLDWRRQLEDIAARAEFARGIAGEEQDEAKTID